jgi:peptidyl-prolyl cis-trans isomerase C
MAAVLGGCERRPVGETRSGGGAVVARVNGKALHQRDFAAMLPDDYQQALTSQELKDYLDRWIATQLLYDEAQRSGLAVTGEIEAKLEQYKKDLVADLFVQEVIREKAVVTDDEVRDYYEQRVDQYTKEYRVSHILLSSLEDVEEVKERLKKRTFSWVERRHSLDRHTGVGGDLGFLSKGNMIPEFEAVVFGMEVGEVSDVIESEFGYHLIKLTDVRDARSKLEYDEVAAEISGTLLLQKRAAVYDSLIAALVRDADIEITDPRLRLFTGERVVEGIDDTLMVREANPED